MKTLIKLSAFALLIIGIIIGCRRNFSDQNLPFSTNAEFTTAIVKQWYSQTFQRSSEWKSAWLHGKKFPDWKNGSYHKSADVEFLEFPVLKQKTKLLVQKDNSLTITQIRQVVNASISRVVFIRTTNKEIVVRDVDYIPDWQYLQIHQFDISEIGYGKAGDDFTGTMIVKDWNEKILSMRILKDGKVVKKVSIERTVSNNRNPIQARTSERVCELVEYCKWYKDCVVVGDVMTDNCGEPYMDPNDCYLQEECTGEDEDPCELYGIGCEDNGDDDPPPPPDTCEDAQPGADKATTLSQNNNYITSKDNIQAAAVDGNEHSITFGKDANGNITTSSMTTGGTSSGTVNTSWPGAFADMHNHPNAQPPSPGDMYNLISINQNHSGYDTRFVVAPDGSVYALVVVNLNTANTFVTNYPSVNIGYGPDFPDLINDDFINAKISAQSQGYSNLIAEEMAMAFVLDKYNSGMALLKQDGNGNFKRLRTQENSSNGNTTYSANNCQ